MLYSILYKEYLVLIATHLFWFKGIQKPQMVSAISIMVH
jgi:hypothetical protein